MLAERVPKYQHNKPFQFIDKYKFIPRFVDNTLFDLHFKARNVFMWVEWSDSAKQASTKILK